MHQPLISCVVPVFNAERYLGKALDSILAQTYRPIEIVAVDDGSADGSAQVLASYGDRVRRFHQANAGPATAYNRGVAEARGAYIAFLDADDLWYPEKLALQMARFGEQPAPDVCLTYLQDFLSDELGAEAIALGALARRGPVVGYSVITLLTPARVFERVGPFDTALDRRFQADWFARARDLGVSFEVLPDVLVSRRLHRSNLSRRGHADIRDDFLTVVKRSLDRRRRTGGAGAPEPVGHNRATRTAAS
jgi:glycosyltransferase involved in cell wall biosynthesis